MIATAPPETTPEDLRIRVHGDASLPTLVYLPGLHGDWTLVSSFRAAVAGRVRFAEFTYPRTTSWSLDDHARWIEEALLANGVTGGWLIGESFGSQPAWQMIRRAQQRANGAPPSPVARKPEIPTASAESASNRKSPTAFQPQGLILAGGFVRHPTIWAVRLAQRVSGAVSLRTVERWCRVYAGYAKFRHRHAPETLASIEEFVANRTVDADRHAITYRYGLIAGNDLRAVARATTIPVYYLAGLVDPLVPWCHARWWLRRNCPGYFGGRTIWRADHNVLATAPQASAKLILQWIRGPNGVTE
jgi:pimeloyl-ACP methyl ester carboxylesterase